VNGERTSRRRATQWIPQRIREMRRRSNLFLPRRLRAVDNIARRYQQLKHPRRPKRSCGDINDVNAIDGVRAKAKSRARKRALYHNRVEDERACAESNSKPAL